MKIAHSNCIRCIGTVYELNITVDSIHNIPYLKGSIVIKSNDDYIRFYINTSKANSIEYYRILETFGIQYEMIRKYDKSEYTLYEEPIQCILHGKKRQKIDQMMHKKASLVTKDEFGNEIETGFKSEIQGVTLKNDPQKARGKRGKLILWEEAGKFRDILQAWQIARPSVEEAGYAYGLMIAFGTGGEEGEDFDGLRELFYKPSGYNVEGFNNIWDEHADGTECGFFVPEFANMSTLNEDGSRKYMDQDGNSLG